MCALWMNFDFLSLHWIRRTRSFIYNSNVDTFQIRAIYGLFCRPDMGNCSPDEIASLNAFQADFVLNHLVNATNLPVFCSYFSRLCLPWDVTHWSTNSLSQRCMRTCNVCMQHNQHINTSYTIINTSAHQHFNISTSTHQHNVINSSRHQHTDTLAHQHIITMSSTHP